MPSETSTICFRVQIEERELIEAIAHTLDMSLSTFARQTLLAKADSVLQEQGTEAVIKKDREYEERRLNAASRRVEARGEGLRLLKEQGTEAVTKKDREHEERRLNAASRRVEARGEGLSRRSGEG